jgi:hypothetical protein
MCVGLPVDHRIVQACIEGVSWISTTSRSTLPHWGCLAVCQLGDAFTGSETPSSVSQHAPSNRPLPQVSVVSYSQVITPRDVRALEETGEEIGHSGGARGVESQEQDARSPKS